MAKKDDTTFFENKLLDFVTAKDPIVVGIFPSTDSYIRLIISYLLEYSEDWQTERCYINAGSIKVQKEILFNVA